MTSSALRDRIETKNATALSRLGSSKALYAETGGELDATTVLRAAAVAERAAQETLEGWAEDESHEGARETFESIAAVEAEHFETVVSKLDDPADEDLDTSDVPAIQAVLREYEATIDRAGALLGRCLVAKKSKEQYTGYFVGDADPRTASVFRELGSDVTEQIEQALELIEEVCADDADVDQAVEAATEAIQAAYEEYTDSLESMGVNPKPVC
ncbi:rubrerythrin family protein [Halalkalirubrum salinum]|uniref:rubrerythrin family protein n=1 Tax=Halalkalirubrum salinum TaxID=2563889 RepID=UPI0010FB7366|nr:rubrerythrin family protein [Halalkalirubrum salinum]